MKKHWQNALSISLAFIVLTSFFQNCGKPIQNLEETASNASTGDNNDSNCEIENISIDAYENDILLNSNELKLNSTINFNIISRYRLTDIEWRIEQGLGETVAEAFNNDNINYNFTQAGNYNVYVVGKDSSCTRVNKAASFVVKAAACAATSPIDFSINPSSGPYSLGSSVVLSLQNPSIYKTGSIKWKIFKEVSNNSQTSLVEHAEVSQQTSFNASSYLNAEAAFQIQVSAELNQAAPCNTILSSTSLKRVLITDTSDKSFKLVSVSMSPANAVLGTQTWQYNRASSNTDYKNIFFNTQNLASCTFTTSDALNNKSDNSPLGCATWSAPTAYSTGSSCSFKTYKAQFTGKDGNSYSQEFFTHCPANSNVCTFGRYTNPNNASDIDYNANVHHCNVTITSCPDYSAKYCKILSKKVDEFGTCFRRTTTLIYSCQAYCDSTGVFKNEECEIDSLR